MDHQAVRAAGAVLFARQFAYAPPRLADCVAFLAVISARVVGAWRGPLRSRSAAATRALACSSLLALAGFFVPAATHAGLRGRLLLWLVLPLPRFWVAAQVGMLHLHSRPRLFPPPPYSVLVPPDSRASVIALRTFPGACWACAPGRRSLEGIHALVIVPLGPPAYAPRNAECGRTSFCNIFRLRPLTGFSLTAQILIICSLYRVEPSALSKSSWTARPPVF